MTAERWGELRADIPALEREGQLEEALRSYRAALDIAPELLEAATNEAHVLVMLGRPGEGLPALHALARSHPRSPAVLWAITWINRKPNCGAS